MDIDLPKLKRNNRNLTAKYSLLMTPEMKMELEELKTFNGIDVAQMIRDLIDGKLRMIRTRSA